MTTLPIIRTLIVDDHDHVRRGLALMLQAFDDLLLVGQAANGADAVRLCREVKPDVVLMDILMPVMDGVTATRAIRASHAAIGVVAMTSFNEEYKRTAALKAGAHRCVGKDISIDELAAAIRAAYVEMSHERACLSVD